MSENKLTIPANTKACTKTSRRQFLTQLTSGALLALSGCELASAAVHHVYPAKKSPQKVKVHPVHHTSKTAKKTIPSSHHHKSAKLKKAALPHTDLASTPKPEPIRRSFITGLSNKSIALYNINTGDRLNLTYYERGQYITSALDEINHLFRDYHTDTIHPIDPLLIDQLYDLKRLLEVDKPYAVISGYRSPFTNAVKRIHSSGVAKHSLHMEGRAIDIRIEGLATQHIRNAALAMRRGGVGYYPHANFVHLDTGEFRTW